MKHRLNSFVLISGYVAIPLFAYDLHWSNGNQETVINDLKLLIEECNNIGLKINASKFETYFTDTLIQSIIGEFQAISPGIKIVDNLELRTFRRSNFKRLNRIKF